MTRSAAFWRTLVFLILLCQFPGVVWGYTLSIEGTPTVEGTMYSLKGEDPGTLTVTTNIKCSFRSFDDCPSSLSMKFNLKRGTTEVDSNNFTPSVTHWEGVPIYDYRSTTITYSLQLPAFGDGDSQTSTAYHSVNVGLLTPPPRGSGLNIWVYSESSTFYYTVFSGLLKFRFLETHLSSITSEYADGEICSSDFNLTAYTGTWDNGFTSPLGFSKSGNDELCVTNLGTSVDGFSVDLDVDSGEVDFPSISGQSGGITWILGPYSGVTLSYQGVSFAYALVTLPDSVTQHAFSANQILPKGYSEMLFDSGNSTGNLDTVTLSFTGTDFYLHGENLPFYVFANGASFPLGGGEISLVDPTPVYVHKEAEAGLSDSDPRKANGFPSNDSMFREASSITTQNDITISQYGLSGSLTFDTNAGFSSFPSAYLSLQSDFTIELSNGVIHSSTTMPTSIDLGMQFDPDCPSADCGNTMGKVGTSITSTNTAIFSNGAVAGQFSPAAEITWGGSDGTDATFKRNDTGETGIWMVPGFIMPGTAATEAVESDLRVSQVLLGSVTFLDAGVMEPDTIHPLNDLTDWSAKNGDGFFAGINIGPEDLIGPHSGTPTVAAGQGSILNNFINLRFNGNSSFTSMVDRPASKYFYRRGGLTGVFNTTFDSDVDGAVSIYGYDIYFDRFAFRQDRNILSSKTFIDGSLTIQDGPVGGGSGKPGLAVGFTDLDLTCNGNLGNGSVDTEAEPGWPDYARAAENFCDGVNGVGDLDTNIDEGCQTLDYWNMPILLAGMSFENSSTDTGDDPDCNTLPRELELMTRNLVDGIGTPLTMVAHYPADGTLTDQQLSGKVDTWFDKPAGQDEKPGFPLRLQDAYLNEVSDPLNPPSYGGLGGFAVLSGVTDVPLFNDVSLSGHFSNNVSTVTDDFAISIFADETDQDLDFDGVPDGSSYGTVLEYRALSQSADGLPKPYFSYSWPSAGFIDLSYYAGYNRAVPGSLPQFLGVKKLSDIAEVIDVFSVPDFINPQRTKFSFGASAEVPELKNIQFDVGSMDLNDLNAFLTTIGVTSGDADAITDSLEGLGSAEQWMHDLTGGDITPFLRQAIEQELNDSFGTEIDAAVDALNTAQGAPIILTAQLTAPISNLKTELLSTILPKVDLVDLYTRLAPLAIFNNTSDELRPLFVPSVGTEEEFDLMLADFEVITSALNDLKNVLAEVKTAKNEINDFLTLTGDGTIDELRGYIMDADNATTALWTELDNGIGSFSSADPGTNVLLGQLESAKNVVGDVRGAIESVHLGEIADYLFLASILAGSPLDTSFVKDAEQTMVTMLDQVDEIILSADTNMQALYDDIDFVTVYQQVEAVLGPSGLVHASLDSIDAELLKLSGAFPSILNIPGKLDELDTSVELLITNVINPLLIKPTPASQPTGDIVTWNSAKAEAQLFYLDDIKNKFTINVLGLESEGIPKDPLLQPIMETLSSYDFTVVFAPANFEMLLTAPLKILVDEIQPSIGIAQGSVAGLLPYPTSEDIRRMISAAIVNSEPVQSVNNLFYEQIGRISDVVDDISTQLALQINSLIKGTIAAVSEGLSDALNNVTSTLGFDGASSAGINGFAIVSQDEIERIHLEAEFSFGGDPDPTSYNAALDVATWNSKNGENGKGESGNVCLTEASAGNIDVTISTHDVPADMLGTSVGIKEAVLGFSMGVRENPVNAYPLGVFGRLYTSGSMDFEALTLEDLGLESALGLYELYFGATGAARFQDFNIPKAAFYLGTSCTNEVLERLDPEVADFIGDLSPLTGAYVRGSVEIPIYSNGCALTAGVGADIGAWYFTEPSPGTYGGLLGGSAYGELACLASLKGSVTAIGQKSGPDYKFAGSGWAAAGVGYCSPSKWKKISHARKDDWCLTGDASFEATFNSGDWDVTGPDVSCCH